MPQQTNLNVAPYFDDYDASDDFYRVLFKPGYPVQARELTTLQSILQNQIEKFGQHFFKEGAKVIPGNTGYNRLYYGVQIQNNFQGVPVSAYADQLIGTKITGQRSGVSAVVDTILMPEQSDRGQLTLYVNYLNSSTTNNSTQSFFDGEELKCNTIISSGLLGNASISAGAPFAITTNDGASITGSSFQIQEGVYFVHGQFVGVAQETLILDQYATEPNYRIGLFVDEQIINADIDESLNDNSQGYNNYAAPGADRLKITLSLFKKDLDDFDDTSFVELGTISDGVLRAANSGRSGKGSSGGLIIAGGGGSGSLDLTDTLARRTFDESGNYDIKPFNITLMNSLNDNIGNRGVFQAGQFTPGGGTPSDDLALYKVSPGKAYVKGYEIETLDPTFIDCPKPRDTKLQENQAIIYNTGSTFKLNSVYRTPTVGIGSTYVLSLRDERQGSNQENAAGGEIGYARVYDFRLESQNYSSTNSNLDEWELALYDVQTFTEIQLNNPLTVSVPAIIEGKRSGAKAFLQGSVTAGMGLTVYETSGQFIKNEQLIINGINNGRVALGITVHSISDVKSIYGTDDNLVGINTFNANVVPSVQQFVGIATVGVVTFANNQSVVKSANPNFPGITTVGNLIQYTDLNVSEDPVTARVVSVGSSHLNVTGVTTVSGIVDGTLPKTSVKSVSDLRVMTSLLDPSSDNTLYTPLPKSNISNVDLTSASIVIRKTFDVSISNGQLNTPLPSAGSNESFQPFQPKRYSLIGADGTTYDLTSDQFDFGTGNSCQIRGLNTPSQSNNGATLVATIKKSKPQAKTKINNKIKSVVINYSKISGSGIGATTLNDGLTYGNYPYGTRVQDDEISLNVPDVIWVYGIFESADTSDPSAPKVNLSSIVTQSTTTNELILGEHMVGEESDAVAVVAEKLSDSQISFVYDNQIVFREGETVTFKESGASAVVSSLNEPSFDISPNYTFADGGTVTFFNYGTIKLKPDNDVPERKIKVYYQSGSYADNDTGDITTVNSYDQFKYGYDIPRINSYSCSDIIDIRPRVVPITSVAEGDRSPLEFLGRTFTGSGDSAPNILASDETILVDFSFYLPRIDRIFLTKGGKLQVKFGSPSENPKKPVPVDDALEIATVGLPAFLYAPKDAALQFLNHRRYTMGDIKKLDSRIKNLEYYTSLSLLETNTANFFVPDQDGLNRFKSGFFVDNFTGFETQESALKINNSIDRKRKELRPRHYTNSVDCITGPVVGLDVDDDQQFATIEGVNVRKNADAITLDYSEVEWLKQNFATRSESVTPFLISFWQGTMELTPASDTWVDTARLQAKIIQTEGNYAATLDNMVRNDGVDPQTGMGPIMWNSWETTWTGTTTNDFEGASTQTVNDTVTWSEGGWVNQEPSTNPARWVTATVNTTTRNWFRETIQTGTESRTGLRNIVTETFDEQSVGDRVVSREVVPFMRSRNIEFVAKKVKPLTQLYGFFDGEDVTKYCVPKLIEISMTSGTFQVGEQIHAHRTTSTFEHSFNCRVAQSNHKEGPYNVPTKTFRDNPYTNQPLSSNYSSTSDILNVDTYSLSNQPQGQYYGRIETGMVLKGLSSKAQATVTNVRLISDVSAFCAGSFYIPDPNSINHPRFETGTKVFTLTSEPDNDANKATTLTDETFTAAGTLETVQENILSIRNARVEQRQEFQERNVEESLGTTLVGQDTTTTQGDRRINSWYDPLAQSFLVEDDNGIFITKCDVFFRTKDDMDVPCVFQLRSMLNGFPTQHILPFSEIVLAPDDVITSADGSVATTVNFRAPVYLEGGNTEYAICLASNSTKYSVYISRIGETDLLTDTFISNQPYLGSLFKSQNASTWEPSQWEDLKFTLYRAEFETAGSVDFYNPELTEGNGQIPTLMPNSISLSSRKVRVGLATTVADSYADGNTFSQDGTNATGNLVGAGGSATGTLSISNVGIGYTPLDGNKSFSSVNLVTVTGHGRGAVANVYIENGVAAAATITSGGSGYQVGDVIGITTIGLSTGGSGTVGRDARFTVAGIGMTNEIILDNVQGNFATGVGKTMRYTNSAGVTTELNFSHGGNVTINAIDVEQDGLHIKVNHKNHGMYSTDNIVKISDVASDIKPTKLSIALNVGNENTFSVDDASAFTNFENVGVGTTNKGLVKIEDEVIRYTAVTGNVLTIDSRGLDQIDYPAGTPVHKYELGGVSLVRINRTHGLSTSTSTETSGSIRFDSYNIKIDTSGENNIDGISSNDTTDRSTDVGFPKLYANKSKSAGGYNIKATQNMPFEAIVPVAHNTTVTGTTIGAEIRTTSASGIGDQDIPYIDKGFESVTVGETNYLSSPRAIYSKLNEDEKLDNIVGNKSFQMRLSLGTVDTRLSPVIDTQRVSVITTSNRVDNIITNYATDDRVKSVFDDPTACQYISKEIRLENPATSIKVLLAGHIHVDANVRAFYAISDKEAFEPIFTPFPGFNNLNSRGQVVNPQDSDGQSDKFVPKVNDYQYLGSAIFNEYSFTADTLPAFRYYRVKLLLTSNDQVFVPRIKDLRVMALA
tara:strand:+ start:1039 stop:8625 length:7587 start_codon:yes stop_codon:yes gene_type:complete